MQSFRFSVKIFNRFIYLLAYEYLSMPTDIVFRNVGL